MSKVNAKHKAFADLYLLDPKRNACKAYKAVYGNKIKNSVAKAASSRLLQNVNLQSYIKSIEDKTSAKVEVSVEWIKAKLKRFSEAKITDFFEFKNGGIYLKDLHKLPPEIVDCIQEIQETKEGIKIKLVDKRSSLTDLGRHLGMFKDNVAIEGSYLSKVEIVDLTDINKDKSLQ